MASLATCPLCAKQLAIPDGTTSDDRAECPECDATFLLSNAFQTSLPTARILPALDTTPTAESTPAEVDAPEISLPESTPNEQSSADVLDSFADNTSAESEPVESNPIHEEQPAEDSANVASLASWESRLKQAIERDAAELTGQPPMERSPSEEMQTDETQSVETPADEAPSSDAFAAQSQTASNPEFDFHIDPPAAEQTVEAARQEEPVVPEFDQAEPTQPEKIASINKTPEPTQAKSLPLTSELAAEELKEAEDLTIGLSTLNPRKSRRKSILRPIATYVTSAAAGTFLALYSLMWFKGPSGDHLNLAQVLPALMLPPSMQSSETEPSNETLPTTEPKELLVTDEPAEETQVADAPTIEETPAETPPVDTLAGNPIDESPVESQPENNPAPRNDPIIDEAVSPAAAQQPLPQAENSLPDAFVDLLNSALSAQPEFVGGNLASNEAVSKKGKAYMALCQLAEQFAAIYLPNPDAHSLAQISTAKDIFVSIAADVANQSDLAAIASRWWSYQSRPNQGIFFAGQIQEFQSLGAWNLCYVALDQPHEATIIPVLLNPASIPIEGDRIAVAGNIVAEPNSNLQGFTVDLPQVVVATFSHTFQP